MGNPNTCAPSTPEKALPTLSLTAAGVLNWVNPAFTETAKDRKTISINEVLDLYLDALQHAAQRSQYRKIRASVVALERRTGSDLSAAAQLINTLASSEANDFFWSYGITTLIERHNKNMQIFPRKEGTLSYMCTTLNPKNRGQNFHLKFAVAPVKTKNIIFAEVMRTFSLTEDFRNFKGIAVMNIIPKENSQQLFIDTMVVIVQTYIPGMFLMLALEKSENKGVTSVQPAFAFVNFERELEIAR